MSIIQDGGENSGDQSNMGGEILKSGGNTWGSSIRAFAERGKGKLFSRECML